MFDEELITLHASLSRQNLASSQALKVEGLKEREETQSGEGHTVSEVGEQSFTVRRVPFFLSAASFALLIVDTNRQVQSSRPSRTYSVEGPARPYVRHISLTLSLSKTGVHSNSTSRFIFFFSSAPITVYP